MAYIKSFGKKMKAERVDEHCFLFAETTLTEGRFIPKEGEKHTVEEPYRIPDVSSLAVSLPGALYERCLCKGGSLLGEP